MYQFGNNTLYVRCTNGVDIPVMHIEDDRLCILDLTKQQAAWLVKSGVSIHVMGDRRTVAVSEPITLKTKE